MSNRKSFNTPRVTSTVLGVAILASSSALAAQRYIVQFRSPQAFAAVQDQLTEMARTGITSRDAFGNARVAQPRLLNSQARVVEALDNLDMVVVEASNESEISALRSHSDVSLVEPEFFFAAPKVPLARFSSRPVASPVAASESELTWGIKAVKAVEAWNSTTVGSQGAGARVAILDTGIDKDHPDLKNRLEVGKNFVQRTTSPIGSSSSQSLLSALSDVMPSDASVDDTSTPPSYDYNDTIGHGTHVSGTIAGELDNHGVVGVAPKARLLMGKVCGKFGCSSVAIVNGVNWAIQNKVDVLSMSLGGALDSTAQREALGRAQDAGIVNVAASGNDGTNSISFPAAYPSVLAVGAVDSTLKRASFSQYGPELGIVAPGVDVLSSVPQGTGRDSVVQVTINGTLSKVPSTSFVGSPEVGTPLAGDLAFAGLGKPEDFTGKDFKGKVALISRGEIAFADKVKNAIAAGVSAVVIFNNAPGLISGGLTQDGSLVAVPVAMIEQSVGEGLRDGLAAGRAESTTLLTIKTDYASFQGTSMATPHVAGVAARPAHGRGGRRRARGFHALVHGTRDAVPRQQSGPRQG